jgi:hypothetical protein
VVFVADDLMAWLVGKLADAGSKRLITWAFGSDQERELRRAATAAVQRTADELRPEGGERTEELAMVVSQVFRKPLADVPQAGQATLLEALQAGIARQLAVLDDAGLTGAGQSSADVLGLPAGVLADRLASHLVREIVLRGSRGGPLTPLADQLNQDETHLQGQRIEDKVDHLAGEVRDALARPGSAVAVAGRPLEEMTDPFALEVHRPVQPEDPPPALPELPTYVPREHDTELGSAVRAAAAGRSAIAVLVGGSSTGKTRACWEALQLLRDRPERWRLWHPIDPTRPDAALRELPGIGPRTVVWLNEAQFYLDVPDGGLGERVAAGLRELLRNPARAPVLVLATLWPQFWDTLTARPPGGPDPHAQARELLAGHDITVPAAFTPAQLGQLARAADARLALAAAGAQDGQVIQFLAGAPELLARYRNAPPAAAGLVDAAMDARRLGTGAGLPQAFLEAAAPGYLTDTEWEALGESWENVLKEAWKYTAVPAEGVRGPLTRIHLRPAISRPAGRGSRDNDDQPPAGQAGVTGGPLYRLADYLDQHGRAHRKDQVPPAGFWAAAAGHAFPGDQAALGDAADDRGLYRAAAQLHKNAAVSGNLRAAYYLTRPPPCLRGDARPASWAAAHVALDDPRGVADLLGRLRAAGAQDQAAALLDRDPGARVALDDLLRVAELLGRLRAAGAYDQAAALAGRAAAHVAVDDPWGVARLLDSLREAGAHDQAAALAGRAAAHVALDDPYGVAELLDSLRAVGAQDQTAELLDRDPAAHVALDDPGSVAILLSGLREAGAHDQAAALAGRAAAHLDNPYGVAELLDSMRAVGAQDQAAELLDRDPAAHVALDDPGGVAALLRSMREAGAHNQAAALLDRDPAAHVALDNPYGVAELLEGLREAGAHDQAAALLDRDPAAHVALDDPDGVAALLGSMREAGAQDQAAALADRAAAHVVLDDPRAVAWLLGSMREVGAQDQAAALADQLPAAGLFGLFLEQQGRADQFRFGREADGSPSAPWSWGDLDLWPAPPSRRSRRNRRSAQ